MNNIEQKNNTVAINKLREKVVEIVFWIGLVMLIVGLLLTVSALYGRKNYDEPITESAVMLTPTIEVNEAITLTDEPVIEEPTIETPVIDAPIDISKTYNNEVIYIAKTVYGEARGCTKTEQAAVVWSILNRVDSDLAYMPDDIISVVTQKHQYVGYNPKHPVTDEIVNLVEDVLDRWVMEKNGEANVGRVLPKNYLWFYGDGSHNHFTDAWKNGNKWDWSLKSPYEV